MGEMTSEGKVYTLARQESLKGRHSVEFLLHLQRVAGERLLVIWDGRPPHRQTAVKEFVAGRHGKVWRKALPAPIRHVAVLVDLDKNPFPVPRCRSLTFKKLWKTASPINLAHDDIDAANDGRHIGDEAATANFIGDTEIAEAR